MNLDWYTKKMADMTDLLLISSLSRFFSWSYDAVNATLAC